MPTYLLVLVSVLVCLAIVMCAYGIFAFRRMSIAFKKLDYLVEDLTYKSELLAPTVETLSRWAAYGDSVENAARKHSRSILDLLIENKPALKKLGAEIKKDAKETASEQTKRRR